MISPNHKPDDSGLGVMLEEITIIECGKGMHLRGGHEGEENHMKIEKVYMNALALPECTNCYKHSPLSCQKMTGLVMWTNT